MSTNGQATGSDPHSTRIRVAGVRFPTFARDASFTFAAGLIALTTVLACEGQKTISPGGRGGSGSGGSGSGGSGSGGNDGPSAGIGGGGRGVTPTGGSGVCPAGGAGGIAVVAGSHCAPGDSTIGDPSCNTWDCGGVRHRVNANACPHVVPRNLALAPTGLVDECLRDTDCTARPIGYCFNTAGIGRCVRAGCVSDASCGAGRLCVLTADGCSLASNSGRTSYFACQTANDQCATYVDCPGSGSGRECRWTVDRFTCQTSCPIP
jgi:hypothetical protein